MKKSTAIILLILDIIVGSLVSFYSVNMFLSDLSNFYYGGLKDAYILSTIPSMIMAILFVLGFILIIRMYRYPQYEKATITLYSIMGVVLSFIGLVVSVLTGVFVYHDFLANYPFYHYFLVMSVSFLLIIAFILYCLFSKIRYWDDDKEKRHIKFKYAIYSGLLFIFVLYAFNRLGALLWSVTFMSKSTIELTFPFYIHLLLPFAILIHVILYFFDAYKSYKDAIKYIIAILIANTLLGGYVIWATITHTEFISAISPCLPLERLATMPIDTIVMIVGVYGLGLYYLVYSIVSYRKQITK